MRWMGSWLRLERFLARAGAFNQRALGLVSVLSLLAACSGRTALHPPEPEEPGEPGELRFEFACGLRAHGLESRSTFIESGQRCEDANLVNTFALRVTGRAAAQYSAVARCGYVRYDNGIFVGKRVAVEARDGAWCHDAALKSIDLVDRMLLTDVSFAIETVREGAPERRLSAQFTTFGGETKPLSPEANLCVYVANRVNGTANCNQVPPSPDCTCPSDPAWSDFFSGVRLTLEED
jgi:hypothetical protein